MATHAARANRSLIVQWDGGVVTKPGVYRGIPLDVYFEPALFGGVPSISSSGLRTIYHRSPKHYWAESPYNPKRKEPEDKEAFIFGRAAHHLLLGEPRFNRFFVVRPSEIVSNKTGELVAWHGSRTECKRWASDQEEAGRTILTPDQAENIIGMAEELATHPLVKRGAITGGETELSYFWRDDETGIWLRWRPDSTPTDSDDHVDIKTTRDIRFVQKSIDEFGYEQQGALGRVATRKLLSREMASFSLLFVEKTSPWDHMLVQVKDSELDRGERMNRSALRTFWRCWKSNEWPGIAKDHIGYIEGTQRYRERVEARLQEEGL